MPYVSKRRQWAEALRTAARGFRRCGRRADERVVVKRRFVVTVQGLDCESESTRLLASRGNMHYISQLLYDMVCTVTRRVVKCPPFLFLSYIRDAPMHLHYFSCGRLLPEVHPQNTPHASVARLRASKLCMMNGGPSVAVMVVVVRSGG